MLISIWEKSSKHGHSETVKMLNPSNKKNAEIYANLKSGEKVAKNVLKQVITQII
jgi:hypothetical protein